MSEYNPLKVRKTGRLRHAWKVWRFERRAALAKRRRDREISQLVRRDG